MPSERFVTTLSSALESTVKRLGETEDRGTVVEALRQRKMGNTRTSIVLGSDNVTYESDAMSRQQDILAAYNGSDLASQGSNAAALKQQLARSNFRIGTEDEKVDYTTTTKTMFGSKEERYGWSNIRNFRGELDDRVGKFIKTSSIHMGSDPISYLTVNRDGMEYRGDQIDYNRASEDTKRLKSELARHNFELSHVSEESNPEDRKKSSTQREYVYDFETYQGARASMSTEVMNDLRREHFSLGYGNGKTPMSAAHETMRAVHNVADLQGTQKHREFARDLKKKLLTTSVVIGEDERFM